MIYEHQFILSLLATIIIEIGVLFLIIRKIFHLDASKLSLRAIIFIGIVCSGLTLPYVWFLAPVLVPARIWFIIIGELFALVAETMIYYYSLGLGIKKSFIASLICNAASFLAGLFLIRFIT